MQRFPRPLLISLSAVALGGCFAAAPSLFADNTPPIPDGSLIGAAEQHVLLPGPDTTPAMVNPTPSQGYLGVGMRDVDSERASQLRLKEIRGAEIVTIDHDAPALKAGLRVHDVILGMNNQPIDGQAQFTRMLHDTPAGRTITLLISRDGQIITLTAQLADRATIEADAWSQHIPVPQPDTDDDFSLPNNRGFGSGFIPPLTANSSYTGLDLDMLGPQLANYFGVHDGQGLLIRRVDDNSPAAAAGLRAGDVITKVNGAAVATTNQWLHIIHANRGKQIQLTVIRDRKENVVPMTAGRGKNSGAIVAPSDNTGSASASPSPLLNTRFNFLDNCGSMWFSQEAVLDHVPPAQFAHDLAARLNAVPATR